MLFLKPRIGGLEEWIGSCDGRRPRRWRQTRSPRAAPGARSHDPIAVAAEDGHVPVSQTRSPGRPAAQRVSSSRHVTLRMKNPTNAAREPQARDAEDEPRPAEVRKGLWRPADEQVEAVGGEVCRHMIGWNDRSVKIWIITSPPRDSLAGRRQATIVAITVLNVPRARCCSTRGRTSGLWPLASRWNRCRSGDGAKAPEAETLSRLSGWRRRRSSI